MAAGTYLPISPRSAAIYERGTISMKEGASQTFKKGAPVIIDANGYVTVAGTGPSVIWGIAAEDAHNGGSDGDYEVICYPLTDSDLWEASAEDALAQTQIGDDYGLVADATTGAWYVDSGSTGDQVSVVGFVQTPSLGAIGDTKARVIIKFNSGNIALN